jgi:hypothetical protein
MTIVRAYAALYAFIVAGTLVSGALTDLRRCWEHKP